MNQPEHLETVLAVAAAQGWEWDQDPQPVVLLYSLRFGGAPMRGRRHFHLAYLQGGRFARTLSHDELLQAFVRSVWALAAIASQGSVLLQGRVEVQSDSCTIYPLSRGEKDETPEWENAYFEIALNGDCRHQDTLLKVERIQFSSAGSDQPPLTPGLAVLRLLESSITPPAQALPALQALASRSPAFA